MASKILISAFLAFVFVVGLFYATIIYQTENYQDAKILIDKLISRTPYKFNISDFHSSLPSVATKYPGGFLKSPEVNCSDTELLILVLSAPQNYERRRAIRENWAKDLNNRTSLFFVLGGVGLKDRDLLKLEAERDLILANFTDSYRNLTLKSVALLDWADQNCDCDFLLKCDDDMYINYPKLRHKLFEENETFGEKTVIGRFASNWKPVRDEKSKYYLSREEFPPKILPDFTSGPAYVLKGSFVEPLLAAVLAEHWLSLEDVLITGIVANYRLGATLLGWPTFNNERMSMTACHAQQFISIHDVRPKEQSLLYARSKQTIKGPCKKVP
ncbi:beta-1,3-galactosyltransferase 5-like [Neocloeon triangulifer]|uniref:beta-1,3-galactosyltransferase 5-like n=1 Tax=Neocloeon triangulifer TaxID=2078957 RepID=UPI00286F181D|nr:beta-1,3-galactosyltransferase 5-like [Neocloeon triangulifer]